VITLIDCGYPEGIHELASMPKSTLSPNPGPGNFKLSGQYEEGAALEINVHDLTGALVAVIKSRYQQDVEIDLPTLSNGVYTVTVAQNSRRDVVRLVIIK
jgi:hypothetical protein